MKGAAGHENEIRPVVLVGGGWDSTVVENLLGIGIAALRRGYHILLHDGPGQGRLLIDEGLPVLQPYLSSSVKVRESHEHAAPLIHFAPKHKLTQGYVALHAMLEERRQSEARKLA